MVNAMRNHVREGGGEERDEIVLDDTDARDSYRTCNTANISIVGVSQMITKGNSLEQAQSR